MYNKLYESLTDASIDSFLELLEISIRYGVFNDEIAKEIKMDIAEGVKGSLKLHSIELSNNKKDEYLEYVNAFLSPIYSAQTMKDLYIAITYIVNTNRDVLARLSVKENLLARDTVSDYFHKLTFDVINYTKKTYKYWQSKNENVINLIVSYYISLVYKAIQNTIK